MPAGPATSRPHRLVRLTLLLGLAAAPGTLLAATLSELMASAENHDPNYRAALAAADAVRSERNVVRAGLLPEVSFQARIGGNSQRIDVAPGAVGLNGPQSFDAEFYEASARQPILHWDRWLSLKQSDSRVAQVEAEVAAYYAAMVLQVAERYFDVVGARSDLISSTAELRALEAQYEQVQTRFSSGAATEAELIEAEADVDRAAAELIRARAAIDIGRDALTEIVGTEVDVQATIDQDADLGRPSPDDLAHWTALAAERNPDLLSAQAIAGVADFDQQIAYAGHLPTVDLVGKYGLDSQGGRFGETDITGRSIGVEIEVPLFQGGAVYYQRKAAGFRAVQADAQADAAARKAVRDASEAYRRIGMSIARETASRRALSSSIAALGAIESQYESGFRTIADVIEAQKNVFDAQRKLTQARRHIIVDTLKLKAASGALALDDIAAVDNLVSDDQSSIESASRALLSSLAPERVETAPVTTRAAEVGVTSTTAVEPGVPAAQNAAVRLAAQHSAGAGWQINVASFRGRAAAQALAQTLRAAGYDTAIVAADVNGADWHRVRITGFDARPDAEAAIRAVGPLIGSDDLWVVQY